MLSQSQKSLETVLKMKEILLSIAFISPHALIVNCQFSTPWLFGLTFFLKEQFTTKAKMYSVQSSLNTPCSHFKAR